MLPFPIYHLLPSDKAYWYCILDGLFHYIELFSKARHPLVWLCKGEPFLSLRQNHEELCIPVVL